MLAKFYRMLRASISNWSDDGASNWAAALAFYTMMSIGPLLVVAVSITGLVFGQKVATDAMLAQLAALMGDEASTAIGNMMQQAAQPSRGVVATAVGLATLLFGATGVFAALQDAMDALWHVRPRPDGGLRLWLKKRFFSMSMVLGLGFLLMVSLVLNGAISAIWQQGAEARSTFVQVSEFLTSWALGTLLIAGIFKVLPDAEMSIRSALVGAVGTALLLNVGRGAIGLYLGHSNVTSAFGAAGSLALVLLWVYYAAQVLFLGAAFTRVYCLHTGARLRPDRDAQAVETVAVEPGASGA